MLQSLNTADVSYCAQADNVNWKFALPLSFRSSPTHNTSVIKRKLPRRHATTSTCPQNADLRKEEGSSNVEARGFLTLLCPLLSSVTCEGSWSFVTPIQNYIHSLEAVRNETHSKTYVQSYSFTSTIYISSVKVLV